MDRPLTPEEMVAIENQILARKLSFAEAVYAIHRHDESFIHDLLEEAGVR